MISRTVTLPQLALIAATRAALGAGVGLLLAERVNSDQRRAVGWTLLAIGAISTVPLAADLLGRHCDDQSPGRDISSARSHGSHGAPAPAWEAVVPT